ncbi:G-protein beta WD- 40 repeats containing protein [Penicillium taxi]|uniref:G-protein beta WD- 40 repeats containing protein n=1 Tax=Penicillium taxi TaxID=168475 RepID=UPI00254597C0|nr:G-protein beta WD- 40 repeats containing protein [Penicillium taxi]KAJ5908034.1 G-protein beta WD- 40 repeats containing protein [Penicillium taxi]
MISIGIIEELSQSHHESTIVAYSFCQNADDRFNSLEAIIKGLIRRLVDQQPSLKKSLRDRWDTKRDRFKEDVSSWHNLWNILLEMLELSKCQRLYMIVDALDECLYDGMADFLKLIVRNGLDRPAKIKWMLTSRPLESADKVLLARNDQVQINLEQHPKQVSEAVEAYVASKTRELSLLQEYGQPLERKIQEELIKKAEGTFLWVGLVCEILESVCLDEALAEIEKLPPTLDKIYDRILQELSKSKRRDVQKHMRLLTAMMLAYRPLKVEEVNSVTGLTDTEDDINAMVDRCASIIKKQDNHIEFVHQSARDYLAGDSGKSILGTYGTYGHGEVVQGCLSYLSDKLTVNLLQLTQPDSTRDCLKAFKDKKREILLASVDYAAIFWVQHLVDAKNPALEQEALAEEGAVSTFLQTKLLEWVECLSLLKMLPRAVGALKQLSKIAKVNIGYLLLAAIFANQLQDNHWASTLVQDATRFLLRHYHVISNWPLQTYTSAVIFSPDLSIARRKKNLAKIPRWLRKLPHVEENWASLIQTLVGHSGAVRAVAFSPNGKQIASGSLDNTIKLWDATTGDAQKTLVGHSGAVTAVAFSPDGKQIASGSYNTIKLWNATTGDAQKTIVGHSGAVIAVAFSSGGKQIVSSSYNNIKLWDATTGDAQKTLVGRFDYSTAVAFSPDGKQIASGSFDNTIKLWDSMTGDAHKTLVGHSGAVTAVAFSADSKQIASSSYNNIKLWDATTGDAQKTLEGHLDHVAAVAFSPDGKQIASGSFNNTVKLWNATTGDAHKTLVGHSGVVRAVTFSPDGKQIASGSLDNNIKLWDASTGDAKKTLVGHSGAVRVVAFSPDSKQIASGSFDDTIKLWDALTGDAKKTLVGHSGTVTAVTFSPDGKQIASSSFDNTIKLWDASTGDAKKTLVGHSSAVTAVAFSPDGKQIASGSFNNTIKLWNATTGDAQKTLVGHSGAVRAVAFSLNSKQIASVSDNGTIKLWDATTGGGILIEASKYLWGILSSHWKFSPSQEISTPGRIHNLRLSRNPQLAANIGFVEQSSSLASSLDIHVSDQWICYGEMHLLRLPSNFIPSCYDSRSDQLTIGFQNGRVLSFAFDASSLQSLM